ncbi:MAG TPA: zinc ABC transporter ATP-binding protein, partial [Lysinibacillus sp.]|nr:zinc ABC transporter ATP-binding protein [Lysinibacillus sp.]
MKTTLIDIENVSFQYDYTHVLKNISFRVEEGDFLALLGRNSYGRST